MTNKQPSIFTFPLTGAKVRTILRDGEPWFVAKDVAEVLGYANTALAIRQHCKYAKLFKQSETLGLTASPRGITLIQESDIYCLIMRSKLPQAEAFSDWVTGTVLPAIRKDGMYIIGEEKVAKGELEETEFILKAMEMLQGKVERLGLENKKLNGTIEEHLKLLTTDEWRALNHLYLTRGEKVKLGKAASSLCKEYGILVEKQSRNLQIHDEVLLVSLNVYPQNILDEAAKSCGFVVNMYLEEEGV